MTNKFKRKCLQKFYISSKQEKEWYRKTTSYLEQPSRHFCQHFMRRTTQQTFLTINLASQQKTTKLYFSSQVRKQFKLLTVPFKPLRCCLRSDKLVNCHVWKFYKDLFLNCRVSSWPDLSIKSYFLMVSSLILLRSLRVYILNNYFFQSQWIVALGILTSPLRGSVNYSHYISPRFQRIIVKYMEEDPH